MTLQEIIIKIALFFALFYGAVAITTFITRWLQESKKEQNPKRK